MPEYRGVRYELQWKGRWEWEIFAEADHHAALCRAHLECGLSSEDWRLMVDATVKFQIAELLARGLIQEAPSPVSDGTDRSLRNHPSIQS